MTGPLKFWYDKMLKRRPKYKTHGLPKPQGLYNPQNEHDACGVGMVVDIKNRASYEIVSKGLAMLCNLEHRGAVGADPKAGDGSGLLIQIPHKFLKKKVASDFALPDIGHYAVGVIFMPKDKSDQEKIKKLIEDNCIREGFDILGWRVCPTQTGDLGWSVLPSTPDVFQLFIKRSDTQNSQD
ncbi:MAG: glutamate synthase subunit alpha, partial [Flammeovirgaceae bacterium]|nr:glutamate synthase subunit alpha [Flammeovirgaceae bacterium]